MGVLGWVGWLGCGVLLDGRQELTVTGRLCGVSHLFVGEEVGPVREEGGGRVVGQGCVSHWVLCRRRVR